MKAFPRFPFPGLVAVLAAALSCIRDGRAASFELVVSPTVHDRVVTAGVELPATRSGERWLITRLSYLLSELSFLGEDGAWHTVETDPAWMSMTDQRSRWKVADAPAGRWRALRFSVGLPPSLNERDPSVWPSGHPLNPNLNGLHWSWQGGFIFLALEGRFWRDPESAAAAPGFAYHLARDPFRATVILPASFEVTAEPPEALGIEFDVAKLLDGIAPVSFSQDGSSTHSKDGDPLAGKLHKNLSAAFRIAPVPAAPAPTSTGGPDPERKPDGTFMVPSGFPRPSLPADLTLSGERIALGQRLFHETKLSRSGTLSCASCHFADHALSDPRRFSVGEEGRTGHRNAMPLFNLAWKPSFFWDGRAPSLREQVKVPIEDHRELDERLDRVVLKLQEDPTYVSAFRNTFGGDVIDAGHLGLALETFLITLVSHDSRFDRARRGEVALTELEQRGFELFMTEREPRSGQFGGDCFHCHGGTLFTDHQFRNNGLGIDPADPGRALVTGSSLDEGTFSTPSLRNVALTAPYMHDGRFATLEQVLDHYSEGVERTATLDPNLAKHPDGGLALTDDEKAALIAFLRTLTDDRFARAAFPTEDKKD